VPRIVTAADAMMSSFAWLWFYRSGFFGNLDVLIGGRLVRALSLSPLASTS
jgi:hypothetical protein